MVLSLGEGHAVFLGVTVLVGEDNHEVPAGEVLHELVGQPVHGVLVGDGAATGGDDDEHLVVADASGETWQLVSVAHVGIFAPYVRVAVVDKFADEDEALLPSVELYAAVEVARHAAETFQPAVEAWFELGA